MTFKEILKGAWKTALSLILLFAVIDLLEDLGLGNIGNSNLRGFLLSPLKSLGFTLPSLTGPRPPG